MLFSWGGGEWSEAHHFCWIPEWLLQVASLNVSLQVGQPQHAKVQRVCGDTGQTGPLFLRSHNPVITWVSIMFVVLEVITCGVWIRDCVGLKKRGDRESLSISESEKLPGVMHNLIFPKLKICLH